MQKMSYWMLRFFVVLSLVLIMLVAGLFYTGKLSIIDQRELAQSFTQFIAIQGEDEYVVASLHNRETFDLQEFKEILGMPIGDTEARISLDAHYKYFIKLSLLRVSLQEDTITIRAPKLLLSTPIAFDMASFKQTQKKFALGPNKAEVMNKLQQKAALGLLAKGNRYKSIVYDKAAKALADNLHQYYMANGFEGYYKSIEVVFADEKTQSQRVFNYKNASCQVSACNAYIELNDDKRLKFSGVPDQFFD